MITPETISPWSGCPDPPPADQTIHAMLMIFFFIMPGTMAGLGNLLVPIQLCVPEMMFPKINNLGTRTMGNPMICHSGHDQDDHPDGISRPDSITVEMTSALAIQHHQHTTSGEPDGHRDMSLLMGSMPSYGQQAARSIWAINGTPGSWESTTMVMVMGIREPVPRSTRWMNPSSLRERDASRRMLALGPPSPSRLPSAPPGTWAAPPGLQEAQR